MRVDLETLVVLLDESTLARMKRAARAVLDSDEAEDAVSEAVMYLAARCRRAPFEIDNPTAYFTRSAYTTALRLHRRRERQTPLSATGEVDAQHRSEDARPIDDRFVDALAVRACVDDLPDDLRTVIVLRHWAGITDKEIAVAIDVHVTTVERRMARARLQLLDCLKSFDEGGESQ